MSAMPAHSDSLTFRPLPDVTSNPVDLAGNFVTWHPRVLNSRPDAVLDQDIAVTNPTCFHFDSDLSRAGFGNVAFNQLETAAGFADLCRFHFWLMSLLKSSRYLLGRIWQ
jgi:hypothetical protein